MLHLPTFPPAQNTFIFRGGGGEARPFRISPHSPAKDFVRLFLRGGGLGGICFIPQLLAGLAKNLFLLERVERGAIVLYTSLIFPKFPVNS